jgi:hypothetical protein
MAWAALTAPPTEGLLTTPATWDRNKNKRMKPQGDIIKAVDKTKRDVSGAALRQTHGGNGVGSSEGGADAWNGGGCNPANDRDPADGCDGPGNSSNGLRVA